MKFYKYLMILGLAFCFSVQAHEETANECNEDSYWQTCVHKENPYDCRKINLRDISHIKYIKDDNEQDKIKQTLFEHTKHALVLACNHYQGYSLIIGMDCVNRINESKENTENTE